MPHTAGDSGMLGWADGVDAALAAIPPVGTTAGTVAAGDDSRFGSGGGSTPDAFVVDAATYGDGTTDSTAHVQAKIALAIANGGGTVLVPYTAAGYAFAGTLTLDARVTMICDSRVTLKAVGTSRTSLILFAGGSTDATLSGFTINGNGVITSAIVNLFGAMTRPTVTGCTILDNYTSQYGIQMAGLGPGADMVDAHIDNNNFDGVGIAVVGHNNHLNTKIRGNRITNCGFGIQMVGNNAAGCTSIDLLIEKNHISSMHPGLGAQYPIQFSGYLGFEHTRPRVIGNTIIGHGTAYADPTTPGTADQISLSSCQDFEVSGNTSNDGGDMGITVALGNLRGKVSDNICLRNNMCGIDIGDPTSIGDRDITITGNVLMNNGQDRLSSGTPAGHAGIAVAGHLVSHVAISGNVLGDDQATHTQAYGVSLQNADMVSLGPDIDAGNITATYFKGTGCTNITKVTTAAF